MLVGDEVVLASTAERLQQFLTALAAACKPWGLTISQNKTELTLVGDATACEGCGALQPERSMLTCDTCEAGWHCGCLNPPLAPLPPPDGWQCPSCSASGGHITASAAAIGAQEAAEEPPPLQQGGASPTIAGVIRCLDLDNIPMDARSGLAAYTTKTISAHAGDGVGCLSELT
ncbi:hypothetical protein N2152v2_001016 [Parachlorella kessleri]